MLTVIEKVLLLQDLDLFDLAETEQLAQLASHCKCLDVKEGSLLFRRNDRSDPLFLLVRGRLSLDFGRGPVQELVQGALEPASFFSESRHRAEARTLSECRLLTVSYEAIVDLCTTEAEFSWAISRKLAGKLLQAQRESE